MKSDLARIAKRHNAFSIPSAWFQLSFDRPQWREVILASDAMRFQSGACSDHKRDYCPVSHLAANTGLSVPRLAAWRKRASLLPMEVAVIRPIARSFPANPATPCTLHAGSFPEKPRRTLAPFRMHACVSDGRSV